MLKIFLGIHHPSLNLFYIKLYTGASGCRALPAKTSMRPVQLKMQLIKVDAINQVDAVY